ncbi:beta-ketoacyl-ACP synthase III [Crassaminicella profunda]|uniref:beta-ketoacyl-ACP synthase III n=1 Tax=Crassaminicella profunda TaxID=1286698 RepID=UPI001CA72C3D|nr:beta-ketoacyl-ACP synthase III [Crassaminicella profunda]QZY54024.1 beta-ketoacyl-ACP synthase III [Crassaminicella profunda]
MSVRNVKILGVGKYLPKKAVMSEEIDHRLRKKCGWTEKNIGVTKRYFIKNETASSMGAYAAKEAVKHAGIKLEDISCIICASGSMEQPIPCTASLIQKELGLEKSGIPSFDINSTCLSFVTALDTLSYLVEGGRYENVLIVSSEIASVGINWKDDKSAALFGDGAAAVVLGKTPLQENSKIIYSKMMTFSEGAHLSEIYGGGSKFPPNLHNLTEETKEQFLFSMDGVKIFKMARKIMPNFVNTIWKESGLTIDDITLVIPHQASKSSMELIRKHLNIPKDKWFSIVKNHGNMIAASIPTALYEAIKEEKIKRGDVVILLGTSAGLSLGGLLFEY